MRILSTLLILGVSVLTAGVHRAGAQNSDQQPFSILISAVNPDVKAGETVKIRLRLTNTSNHDIDASSVWERGGTDMAYDYDVRDTKGNLHKRKNHDGPISASSRTHVLKPGEFVEETNRLSEAYDMTRPGQYVVQYSRRISRNAKDGIVKSNKITVTVNP